MKILPEKNHVWSQIVFLSLPVWNAIIVTLILARSAHNVHIAFTKQGSSMIFPHRENRPDWLRILRRTHFIRVCIMYYWILLPKYTSFYEIFPLRFLFRTYLYYYFYIYYYYCTLTVWIERSFVHVYSCRCNIWRKTDWTLPKREGDSNQMFFSEYSQSIIVFFLFFPS